MLELYVNSLYTGLLEEQDETFWRAESMIPSLNE